MPDSTLLYLDCAMGLAGDMTLAALVDAGADERLVLEAIDSLPLDGVAAQFETTQKNGFRSRRFLVDHPPQHVHRGLSDCLEIVAAASLSPSAQRWAEELFRAVAVAEAHVHGCSVDDVHFHEVGAIDSIVDIVGCAVAFDALHPAAVVAAPIPVGRGSVTIAHGVCPLPAQATAELLIGMPLAPSPVDAELTTPTGAAIAKVFVDRFESLPPMQIEQVGYGAGTRSFPNHPNLLRIFRGTPVEQPGRESIALLETNLDDVSGEVIGHTRRRLLEAGALDVWTTPIAMKKDRPGVLLSVLSRPADRERFERLLFDETGTLGVRTTTLDRSIRARRPAVVSTPFGEIAGKVSRRSDGEREFTPEFESCREASTKFGTPMREVYRAALAAPLPGREEETAAVPSPGHDHSHDHDHDHSHDHSEPGL